MEKKNIIKNIFILCFPRKASEYELYRFLTHGRSYNTFQAFKY